MSPVEIVAALFALATILSCGFGFALAVVVIVDEIRELTDRLHPAPSTAEPQRGLRLVEVDEVTRRRAMRAGRGSAA